MTFVRYRSGITTCTVFTEIGRRQHCAGRGFTVSMTFPCGYFHFWTGAVNVELNLNHLWCTVCADI